MEHADKKAALLQDMHRSFVTLAGMYQLVKAQERVDEWKFSQGVLSPFGHEVSRQEYHRQYRKIMHCLSGLEDNYHELLKIP